VCIDIPVTEAWSQNAILPLVMHLLRLSILSEGDMDLAADNVVSNRRGQEDTAGHNRDIGLLRSYSHEPS
jgi:hypothetical protein